MSWSFIFLVSSLVCPGIVLLECPMSFLLAPDSPNISNQNCLSQMSGQMHILYISLLVLETQSATL